MTPDDFRALLDWLYPGDTIAGGHADTRLDGRSLRAYRSGRSTIPPAVAAYLVGRAALRLTLKGWGAELPPVSAELRAEILNRLEEIRRHGSQD